MVSKKASQHLLKEEPLEIPKVVPIIKRVKVVELDRDQLVVKKATPPIEADFGLFDLFPLTRTPWDEEKKRRMRGELIGLSKDRFFVGEIDEEVVGNVWYTHASDSMEVATLGFVYTRPEHRRRGICTKLMEAALQDFSEKAPECSAIYLNTRLDNPAHRIYEKFGFKDYICKGQETVMRLARPTPEEFDREYFGYLGGREIRSANRGDLPKMEALFNRSKWAIKDSIRQVFERTPYERQFVEMMNGVEENKVKCLILENPKKRVTGYALLTSRRKASILDFLVWPEYRDRAPSLLEEILSGASGEIRSYVSSENEEKGKILREMGFRVKKTGTYFGKNIRQFVWDPS